MSLSVPITEHAEMHFPMKTKGNYVAQDDGRLNPLGQLIIIYIRVMCDQKYKFLPSSAAAGTHKSIWLHIFILSCFSYKASLTSSKKGSTTMPAFHHDVFLHRKPLITYIAKVKQQ